MGQECCKGFITSLLFWAQLSYSNFCSFHGKFHSGFLYPKTHLRTFLHHLPPVVDGLAVVQLHLLSSQKFSVLEPNPKNSFLLIQHTKPKAQNTAYSDLFPGSTFQSLCIYLKHIPQRKP